MNKFHKIIFLSFLVAGISIFYSILNAGSLEPSAAPGPTMKTLDEAEPRIPIPSS